MGLVTNAGIVKRRAISRASCEPRKVVTILTATSALACHPSTYIIERAVDSLCAHGDLAGCRHLIVCDGCTHESAKTHSRYDEYKRRLCALATQGRFCTKVEIVQLPMPAGLPGVILAGAARVRTPYVLVYEHDWELARGIETRGILSTFAQCRDVQYVRLNKRRTREAGWDFILKPDVTRRPVPLVRTSAWSANPHFAKMTYYRRMILNRLSPQSAGGPHGFEEPLCRSLALEIRHLGFDRAQRRWGVFIYGRLGDPPTVHHLDGRRQSDDAANV